MPQGRILLAAAVYWAAVFLIGFVLGTLRVMFVAPQVGETAAVLLEMPLMLTASWVVARGIVRRARTTALSEVLAIGALAFALLLSSELVLAVTLFDRTYGQWLAALFVMPGVLGLAGQLIFAAMPALVLSGRKE